MKFIALLVCTLLAPLASAGEDMMDMARGDIRSARMSIIALAMELTPAQQDKFWPIYNSYAREQDNLMAQRVEMLSGYIEKGAMLTDAQAEELALDSFAIQRSRIKRREVYYERFAKAVGPVLAARFIQVDSQISTLLDLEVAGSMPLIMSPAEVEVKDNN